MRRREALASSRVVLYSDALMVWEGQVGQLHRVFLCSQNLQREFLSDEMGSQGQRVDQ